MSDGHRAPSDAFAVLREGAQAAQIADREVAARRKAWQPKFHALVDALLAECRAWRARAEESANASANSPLGIQHIVAMTSVLNLDIAMTKLEIYQTSCHPQNGACWQELTEMVDHCRNHWGVFPYEWLERLEPLIDEFAELYPSAVVVRSPTAELPE